MLGRDRGKILIVGQAPSATSNPNQPLTPTCRNRSSDRLAEIMGVTIDQFCSDFERVNLIDWYSGSNGKGDAFDKAAARMRAREIEAEIAGRRVIFLGRSVVECFIGRRSTPRHLTMFEYAGATCMWCHHTSGVVRSWNSRSLREEARDAFDAFRITHKAIVDGLRSSKEEREIIAAGS